jgi:tRNA splicing endonuclease
MEDVREKEQLPVAVHLGPFLRITDPNDALNVFDLGAFGKGILARSRPITANVDSIRRRKKAKHHAIAPDALLLHASTLQLNLEEAFYLAYELYAIKIQSETTILSASDAWVKFNLLNKCFKYHYVAYRHFRRIGWVLKSGVKYGVDFVMYPSAESLLAAGRNHVHAPYAVTVRYPSDEGIDESDDRTWQPDMSWHSLQSVSRLACQVIYYSSASHCKFCHLS